MNVEFTYSAARAKKSRLARRLAKPIAVNIVILLTILSLTTGAYFYFTGYDLWTLFAAFSLLGYMFWQWIEGDLADLQADVEEQSKTLDLAHALDQYVLARTPREYSLSDVLIAGSDSPPYRFYLHRFGISSEDLVAQIDLVEPDKFWSEALNLVKKHGLTSIHPGVIFTAAVKTIPGANNWLATKKLTAEDVETGLTWQHHLTATVAALQQRDHFGGIARDWSYGYTPRLNQLGHNISQEVETGGFIHRDLEAHGKLVDQMMKMLTDVSKPNVVLVGDVGVGKSTAVYALAKRLLVGGSEATNALSYHQLYNLSAPTLLANASEPGQLERLLIGVLNEAVKAKNVILFFDDAYGFFGSGSNSVDISNLLLPVLEGGGVRMVLSLTPKQWQEISGRNESLTSLFNVVVVNEPPAEDVMRILEDQILLLEGRHKVLYTFFALKEAIRLGERYVHEQAFPGKALRLLELAATNDEGGLVTAKSVQSAVERTRGVKVVDTDHAEADVLLNMEDRLHQRLINQTKAVSAVANALRRARSGVGSPDRPAGTFLFLGPTGVGKTELSKALAEQLYGGEGHLVRVDMNEYATSEDVKRFVSPRGKSGLGLVEQIRKQPYSVVLLDEIEKAHPDVLNVLLQLLDEGQLKDSDERVVSFRDSIIIGTSNAGADEIRARIEKGEAIDTLSADLSDHLIESGSFKPEFINRFDEVVVFRPLNQEELMQVVDLLIAEVNRTLKGRHVSISLTQEAKQWLVEQGHDPRLGARPLRRMVQRTVENVVAKRMLSGEIPAGSNINLDAGDLNSDKENEA